MGGATLSRYSQPACISVALLLFKQKSAESAGRAVLQGATTHLSSPQRGRKAGIPPPTQGGSGKEPDRSSAKGGTLPPRCPPEGGRSPGKGSLEDGRTAPTTTGAGNQQGTTWRGSGSAFHLHWHTLSARPTRVLAGVGLNKRIFSCPRGVGGVEVMSVDFGREPFSASDWVKHKGVVNRAHVYVQT